MAGLSQKRPFLTSPLVAGGAQTMVTGMGCGAHGAVSATGSRIPVTALCLLVMLCTHSRYFLPLNSWEGSPWACAFSF